MSRWAVRKNHFVGDWSVYYDSTGGVSGEPWKRISQWFDTWREAMDYADRMARTVSVVLPRAHALPTGRHTVQKNGLVIEFERSRSYPELQPSYLVIEPEERRPLALALLALAEKEESCHE